MRNLTDAAKAELFEKSATAATFRSQMKRLARKLNVVVEFKVNEGMGEPVIVANFYFEHHTSKLDKLNDKLRMQAYLLADSNLSEVELDISEMTLDFLDSESFAQWHLKAYNPRVNYNYYKTSKDANKELRADLMANNEFIMHQLENASIDFIESCRTQKKVTK